MKKTIVVIVILAAVAYGWSRLRESRLDLGFLKGETQTISRGDLNVPINGTGEIRPKSRAEIKPEASGEVVEIPVEPGTLVSKGTPIIRLDPEDEQRNVTRAENDVKRAEATLQQQRLRLEERKTSALAQIDGNIAATKAKLDAAKYRLDFERELSGGGHGSNVTVVENQSLYDQLLAQLDILNADRKQAEIAIELAQRDVTLAEKQLETAETVLSDARERLRETGILAPIDGMVSQIAVEVGEVVQGGRTTITGGTVLAVVSDISDIYVRTEVADADIGAVLWLAPPEARPGGVALAEELAKAGVDLLVDTTGVMDQLNAVGTPVKIEVDSFRDEHFEGIIERIFPEPKKIQNIVTYLVDIRVTSPNRRKLALVMGMQADVKFTAQAVKDAILIPHDAIRRGGPSGELGVYVEEPPNEQGKSEPRFVPCRFGIDNGLYAELLEGEGIDKGTVVYTKLPANLDGQDGEDEG